MLTDDVIVKLQDEIRVGEKYREAWRLVSKFVEGKEASLFDAFKAAPSTDSNRLVEIRMMASALEGLKNEFLGHIESADIAYKQIVEMEKDGR